MKLKAGMKIKITEDYENGHYSKEYGFEVGKRYILAHHKNYTYPEGLIIITPKWPTGVFLSDNFFKYEIVPNTLRELING